MQNFKLCLNVFIKYFYFEQSHYSVLLNSKYVLIIYFSEQFETNPKHWMNSHQMSDSKNAYVDKKPAWTFSAKHWSPVQQLKNRKQKVDFKSSDVVLVA